jgi:hypothetical protein
MKSTTTTKRLAANRANAARSTRPRTPEGKARSAQNARKHRFTPENFVVIRLEEIDLLTNLRADAIARYQPVDSQELFAVERNALAQQAILRCSALENGLFTSCLNETINPEGLPQIFLNEELTRNLQVSQAHNRNYCLAEGFTRQTRRNAQTWTFFFRYQAQSERLFRRAVEEFERLKALRYELQNEAISEPQPAETTPVAAPETNPPEPPPSVRKPIANVPPATTPAACQKSPKSLPKSSETLVASPPDGRV